MRNFTKKSRKRLPALIYFDQFLQLWFNYHFLFFRSLILRGLKLRAFTLFCDIKYSLKNESEHDPSFLFLLAMLKITPSLILRPLRMGGSIYEVPFPINYWKKIIYGCRWVIKLIKDNHRVISVKHVVDSLYGSFFGIGISFNLKKNVYETAKLNAYLIRSRVFKK